MSQPLIIDDHDPYSRFRLIAWWDQEKLTRARVLVVGAGALGNEVLKNLALLGVGTIHVIDFDEIERTNLTRSVLFRRRDCGRPKAEVAAEALRDLNPDIRVHSLAANVMTGLGLGFFQAMDVVISCLDNREARLWVNRQCWKVGTPWVDGAIQEINGVVKVFVPPDSACYECAMTEMDYRLINLRYSCPLLRQEDLVAGKVPTAPTISSIIAGLQTQEALKLIHGLPVSSGQALVFNGAANRFYATAFQRREECLSHETYGPIHETHLSAAGHSPRDVWEALAIVPDGDTRVHLDRDLVVSLTCEACGWERPVMRPLPEVRLRDARCARCHETARPRLEHTVDAASELSRVTLASLGVPAFDIVRVEHHGRQFLALLGGDRETAYAAFSASASHGDNSFNP
ncbi:MAG: ThiF family adenylyltransferase [Pirellulaceae bacterium]